jgi:5-methylcytosine-specific restriction protein B
MRPAEARAWIRARIDIPAEDLTRLIRAKSKQTIFENDVHWARFYLSKAGLISSPKRGSWGLTPEGRNTVLNPEETSNIYVRIRDAHRPGTDPDEDDQPAPDLDDESDDDIAYWFVGALWDKQIDQTPRFLAEGIWENGYTEGQFAQLVLRIKPGDRIAIKATFVRKNGLPFNAGGKAVSVMRIKATGTILENLNDGRRVRVAWDPSRPRGEWYFYTYRTTIAEADTGSESARRLIRFTFREEPQDYEWFLNDPYWKEKYGALPETRTTEPVEATEPVGVQELEEETPSPAYTIDDIVRDGCFLEPTELETILRQWKSKKNLILQGPPGTGKTWLAKRLGFALVESNDRETEQSRLRVVQFHPSLSYEDFVCGWRPAGDGRLSLTDGIMMTAIRAAKSDARPFVLVIEEINRGNPAQIFGEMLTLLENTKRHLSEGLELAYRKQSGERERVYLPENLYIIGTMNVADRSLAIVDFAFRRRFAFVDLEPQLNAPWRDWCGKCGLQEEVLELIAERLSILNEEISAAPTLGRQFRIGHSFVTPGVDERIADGHAWLRARVETEIRPLLKEYWYDDPGKADAACSRLLDGLKR